MSLLSITILLLLLVGLIFLKFKEVKDLPRRNNGQYKRKIPVKKFGVIINYIYL